MKGREIKLGELELIKNEVIPHSRWAIGRVYKLLNGTDNKIRAAYLKVINDKNNIYLYRPVTELCPLEIHCEFRLDKVVPSPKKNEDNSLQQYLESSRPKRTVTGILKTIMNVNIAWHVNQGGECGKRN